MNYTEFLHALQDLIKDKTIRQADLARALGTSTSNLSQKFNNHNSEVTISDVEKAQNYFGVQLYVKINDDIKIYNNSKKRQFDEKIITKLKNSGERINQLQELNNLSNEQMAFLLNISTDEYLNIKNSKSIYDINILNNLKTNFKFSLDWLLYGE